MSNLKKLIAGNWKMYGAPASVAELLALCETLRKTPTQAEVMICPPATLLSVFAATAENSPVIIGAQNCHAAVEGAFTGELAAEMLRDAGAQAVILGHSERRQYFKESDAEICQKVSAAERASLLPIVCVGESLDERKSGNAWAVVEGQLSGSLPASLPKIGLVVAYEPVWAIGTGLIPEISDIETMHASIRSWLVSRYGATSKSVRILYGGSVKPENAQSIFAVADVDGALVGGASLKAESFAKIIAAA